MSSPLIACICRWAFTALGLWISSHSLSPVDELSARRLYYFPVSSCSSWSWCALWQPLSQTLSQTLFHAYPMHSVQQPVCWLCAHCAIALTGSFLFSGNCNSAIERVVCFGVSPRTTAYFSPLALRQSLVMHAIRSDFAWLGIGDWEWWLGVVMMLEVGRN